jgi:two-component system KDP operon response regulator KdpE
MSGLFTEQTKVLVIEDEPELCRLLRTCLEGQGYSVLGVPTAEQGMESAISCRPDVILLDLDIPCAGGMAVLQRVREWSHVPVLILSVRDNETEKVNALDKGADDFLTRPFSMRELLARIRAARRHTQTSDDPVVFRAGVLSVDLTRRTVKVDDRIVRLTVTEYSLLHLFVRNAGKVLTHAQILREIWGPKKINKLEYLRVYLAALRRKLENDPTEPQLFLTEPTVGYRLVVQE